MVADPRRTALPPFEQALAGLSVLLSDAPWTLTADDLERARRAGLSEDQLLHCVAQCAFFNYLNRVADATGIEYDYDSPLPRMVKHAGRAPVPRPPRTAWPSSLGALDLSRRMATFEALLSWRAYLTEREAPLSRRDRQVILSAAAAALCDPTVPQTSARGEHEERLAAFAVKITEAPWRLGAEDLRVLALGDEEALDAISVASFQSTWSRIRRVVS